MNLTQTAIRLRVEDQLRKQAQRLGEYYATRLKRPVDIRVSVSVMLKRSRGKDVKRD